MNERVAIVGSRDWTDHVAVRDYVYALDITDIVISGGAPGVDQFAQFYAEERGLGVLVYPALWSQYGKRAGPLRNKMIVEHCDRVVAFWDGSSPGTQNTISLAEQSNKPVLIIAPR